jgi:hypothetical protein
MTQTPLFPSDNEPSQPPSPRIVLPFRGYLAKLTGTPNQVKQAERLRTALITHYRERGPNPDADMTNMLRAVTDANWFFAITRASDAPIPTPKVNQLDPKCLM